MANEASITVIIIIATLLSGALCLLCYYLGKAAGRELAREEYERKHTIYTRLNKRRSRIR